MNTKPLLLSLALAVTPFALSTTVNADILKIGPNAQVLTKANTPKRGDSMSSVAQKYGQAQSVKSSKGKITKRNPQITRWDYPHLSVYFENSHVIHSVIHK